MKDDGMSLWPCSELADLNVYGINWSADSDPPNCSGCARIIPDHQTPVLCSYASTLDHVEQVLGTLPDKHGGIRLMMLFQDPPQELPIDICHPLDDPSELGADETRYFCITQSAWECLLLHRWTGDPIASWPTEGNAYHFLRRYFRSDGQWSYDGIVTYFLWLFRPAQAYITNHAKCNFGVWPQPKGVFETCGRTHLSREIELFQPDILLSFTFRIAAAADLRRWCGLHKQDLAVLRLPHPATDTDKVGKVLEALVSDANALDSLGYDLSSLLDMWMRDATAARDSTEQAPDLDALGETDEELEFEEVTDAKDEDLDDDADDDIDELLTAIEDDYDARIVPIDVEISRVTANGRPGTVLSWELVSHNGRVVTQWRIRLDEDDELYEFLSPPAEIEELPG